MENLRMAVSTTALVLLGMCVVATIASGRGGPCAESAAIRPLMMAAEGNKARAGIMSKDGSSNAAGNRRLMMASSPSDAAGHGEKAAAPTGTETETRLEPRHQGSANWHARESLHYVPSSPDPIQNK